MKRLISLLLCALLIVPVLAEDAPDFAQHLLLLKQVFNRLERNHYVETLIGQWQFRSRTLDEREIGL